MFIRDTMAQRLASQTPPRPKWRQHNRHAAVYTAAMRNPTQQEWYNSVFARVDQISCFFMVSATLAGLRFYYSLEAFERDSLIREEGVFEGFDCVSAEFRGLRFHWSRESGKIIISDV